MGVFWKLTITIELMNERKLEASKYKQILVLNKKIRGDVIRNINAEAVARHQRLRLRTWIRWLSNSRTSSESPTR
jgi:hypothetical protein